MPLMSYREYARHRGCTLAAVQKAIGDADSKGRRDGRIGASLVAIEGRQHPKIDSDKADALWTLNTEESKRSLFFEPEKPSASEKQPGVEDEPMDSLDDPELVEAKKDLYLSRVSALRLVNEGRQLDLDQRKGKLIDLEEAKQLGYTTLRTLRDALRNTGPRIAAQVAALSDPYACEQLINSEIDAALASVTADKLLTDQDDDDDGEGE